MPFDFTDDGTIATTEAFEPVEALDELVDVELLLLLLLPHPATMATQSTASDAIT